MDIRHSSITASHAELPVNYAVYSQSSEQLLDRYGVTKMTTIPHEL